MSWLNAAFLGEPLWMWLGFLSFVTGLLAFDLGFLSRKATRISVAQSMRLSAFYIAMGVAFAGFIWFRNGSDDAVLYLTGYMVEESLSLDNIFVMALIFNYFRIPQASQHRALVYGILGVVILRGIMIGVGSALVEQFHWVLQFFAAFLVFTGIKMLMSGENQYDVSRSRVLRFLMTHMRVTPELNGQRFFVAAEHHKSGRICSHATPLFMALVTVEIADVIFAVDSVPAIFTITTDPYIVFTSNIFAVLGLRALYFALSAMLERFALMKYALSAVLIFIGGKIFAVDLFGLGDMPPLVSLAITGGILALGVAVSLWRTKKERSPQNAR